MAVDSFADGDAYERFIGRWSAPIAGQFIAWLAVPAAGAWVDVGCGTGRLSAQIVATGSPATVLGVDPSRAFVEMAARRLGGSTARFAEGRADLIPAPPSSADAVVSGLVLNFVPDVVAALEEARRVARPGATIAAYVWDYAGRMELLRMFWDAAVALDPRAAELDEGRRFGAMTQPERLREAWLAAGLEAVEVRSIETPTRFVDFDDYWEPFTADVGPAPGYASSLPDEHRARLRDKLRTSLPIQSDGSIHLVANAWAVLGRN